MMKGEFPHLRSAIFFRVPAALLLLAGLLGAQTEGLIDADYLTRGARPFPRFWNSFRQAPIPPPNLQNTPLLGQMIHDGKVELSLNDFLKLAAQNELDLEGSRYTYLISQTDLLRARSGQAARGLPGAPVPAGLFAGAIGAGLGSNNNGFSPGGTGAASISAAARQVTISPRGTFDPAFSANFSFDRVVSPLNTVQVAGTPTVTVPSTVLQTRFQHELPTGLGYSVGFNMQRQSSTQRFLLYDPGFQSFLSFTFYQPLLNGFGIALNRRFITFTENNRQISREIFRQQLNNSLLNAANLYWDFVALTDQVQVAEQSVRAAQTLYDNSRKQAEAGALARLDVLQSEAQLAASRRDLIVAQTNLRMQEVRLKSVVSKSISPELDQATIVPLDALPQASAIEVPTLASALDSAMRNRPVIHEGELQLKNQAIAERFTRNNLRPSLNAFAEFNSYSLAGNPSAMFRKMVQWVYPEYALGFTLTFPLFNRAAQADNIRARLDYQQAEVSLAQTKSQVGLAVRSAQVALIQSKAQIEAAQQARQRSEEALRGEQVRLQNGLSTPYAVILAQRDLAAAQLAEIQAQVIGAKAEVALQLAIDSLLDSHGIPFEESLRGDVWTRSAN